MYQEYEKHTCSESFCDYTGILEKDIFACRTCKRMCCGEHIHTVSGDKLCVDCKWEWDTDTENFAHWRLRKRN